MIDHKLGNYDRGYNSPTPKIVVGVMVVVNINTMPLNVIKKEVSLWAKNPFGLSKDLGPKWRPNIQMRDESKEIRDFMKVKEGGMHHNRYDGHCKKQWIKITKATWSPFLRKRSTCQTLSNKTSLMKDDVNDGVPNGTFKILIPFYRVIN